MKKVVVLIILCLWQAPCLSRQKIPLVINEIMQSNIDAYFCNWEYPDSWVEIYNPTENRVSMNGWALGNTANFASAYPLSLTIAPKGYVVIPCDNTGRKNCPDFRLESDSKGELYLFDRSGNIVDHITYPIMAAPNIAYGRITDGGSKWGWEMTATPMRRNEGRHTDIVLPDPEFSIDGCLMKEKETAKVTITIPTWTTLPEDTRIYVTFDGSEPTVESMSGTELEFNITQTTILRAKLISSEALSPRAVTQSFIYHPRETTFPIISVVGDDKDFYDSIIGMYSDKKNYSNMENFRHNWRRPVNIEYLNSDEIHFSQIGEACIAGGGSRIAFHPQKSLKLYAHKRFGKKSFKGRLWSDKPDVKKVKSFVMRNGGNTSRSYRITDAMVQKLFGLNASNIDWIAYEPALMYINGVYKGVFGLRERSNERYIEANNNGLEDIDYIESYNDTSSVFMSLKEKYQREDITYEELAEEIDIDNFTKTLIAECYASNTDYPHNNIAIWRPRVEGGKWRWILKDVDFMQYSVEASFNMFNYMTLAGEEGKNYMEKYPARISSHLLYQKLMAFQEFVERFIDLYAVYLGDFLQEGNTTALIDAMANEIEEEVGETWKSYNIKTKYPFSTYASMLKGYCKDRPGYVYRQMADYFSLGNVIPVKIERAFDTVAVCGTQLTQPVFRGAWFESRPLRLSGVDDKIWSMTVSHSDGTQDDYDFERGDIEVCLADYSDCRSVYFHLIDVDPDGVESRTADIAERPAIYDLHGRIIPQGSNPKGVYIKNGKKVAAMR